MVTGNSFIVYGFLTLSGGALSSEQMASEQLVTVEPNELLLETKTGSKSPSTLTLTNTCSQRVAFRVQTNNPDDYLVRPNCGFLDASQSAAVSIELLDRRLFRPKDRFLVSAAPAADDKVDRLQFWQSTPSPVHQRVKVGVRLRHSSTSYSNRGSKSDARVQTIGKGTTQDTQIAALRKENERLRHRDEVAETRTKELELRLRHADAEVRALRTKLDAARRAQQPVADGHRHGGVLLGLLVAVALVIGVWLTTYFAA
jgi:hypothetical protein